MWAKAPWYKDNRPRWHSLTLVNYSLFFVFKNPNHPLPHALPRGWELSHTSLSTLAQVCYSTLFSLTGLFRDCSAQEDVWIFWKNHHFFSESIHKQFVLCVCVCVHVCAHVCTCTHARLCLTLCNPMDSSIHGVFQARMLKWVTISSSRGSSRRRDGTHVSCMLYCREILYHCANWEAQSL